MSISGKSYWIAAFVITAVAWIASAIVYPRLPEQVPIHWNIRGEVDGYGSRMIGAFLAPALLIAFLGVFAALPQLSPKKFAVETFQRTYLFVMLLTTLLFAYIHMLILYATVIGNVQLGRAVIGGIMMFFVLMGNVMGKVRRNFYMGVRTPWTLASERVWNDTHRLTAWLFVAAGIIGIVMLLTPIPEYFVFGVILLAAIIPIVYSFVHYKRLERRGLLEGDTT